MLLAEFFVLVPLGVLAFAPRHGAKAFQLVQQRLGRVTRRKNLSSFREVYDQSQSYSCFHLPPVHGIFLAVRRLITAILAPPLRFVAWQ